MSSLTVASLEERYEIERFLLKEARLFDTEGQREWLDTMVDKSIRYQLLVHEERFRSDKSTKAQRAIPIYDDQFKDLDLRVRQFETGMQPMLDPAQVFLHAVSNIEVFKSDDSKTYVVRSYCTVHRARREYEKTSSIFEKNDVIVRTDAGDLLLMNRLITLGQRVITDKNLLFFI